MKLVDDDELEKDGFDFISILLKTELLKHKLFKESVAIVLVLENEIVVKNVELERALEEVERLRKGHDKGGGGEGED
ncbi:hypothetical protein V6N13_037426 [Hibiscus sabdariffa]|uniref:Uncharacterized protein n=1 Tax=Hibiscus sabdariffa TaxID=183260 RepID=A0ABR2E8X5_9ROSI